MQTLYIHPDNPQARLIAQVTDTLKAQQAIITPTPFGYGLMIAITAQKLFDKLTTYIDNQAYLVCRDVSQLSQFVTLDNEQFASVRQGIKQDIPPIFVLPNKDAPKFLGKTIHISFAKDPISLAILDSLQAPLIILPFDDESCHSDYETGETHGHLAEILISIGLIDSVPKQVIDLI